MSHNFAQNDIWLALGHYQNQFWHLESTIDSDNFFLSKQGKHDPQAELQATLDLFRSSSEKRCYFPARWKVLSKYFSLPSFPTCPSYEQFKKDLNYTGLTLIYTDSYMSNPSSLFGHTLLRIDIPQEKKTQLMAHGANYGAFIPPGTNGALFAILGLTGGFLGSFTVKPYYEIINTYNNIENRDIWEFKLNLTPKELDLFIAHLWEIGHTQTKYYFLTENCSYLLLEMLDVIRPDLKLSHKFPVHTIPLDTLKAVSKANLIKEVKHRPSRQKRIQYIYDDFSSTVKKRLKQFARTYQLDLNHLSSEEKAKLIQGAYEYIQYQWESKKIPLKLYRKTTFSLLKESYNFKDQESIFQKEESFSPLQSHASSSVHMRLGTQNNRTFYDITFRPAYHSLTDNWHGLLKGAEINFLTTTLRKYHKDKKLELQDLTLIGITSLTPYDSLFQPISYTVQSKFEKIYDPRSQKNLSVFSTYGGAGLTINLHKNLWLYTLLNGGIGIRQEPTFFLRPLVGILLDYPALKILGTVEKSLSFQHLFKGSIYTIKASIPISNSFALEGELKHKKIFSKKDNQISGGFVFYF